MYRFVFLLLLSFNACTMSAQLDQHQWKNRLLLVFAPYDDEALVEEQLEDFAADKTGLVERDLLVYQIYIDSGETPDGKALSAQTIIDLRQQFQVRNGELVVVLIGKDGGEKLRRTNEILTREVLYNTIDAMPMRRNEMRRRGKKPN
ncbi:MAG: DUF4174 domain-containing protein [Bacteroidota bacterium]